ncbi:hypothetical protein VPH35_054897 [Triticum aestivum]|uniref:Uncharacterized protein n=1 Tax=Triticum aestivum TaxID=4565 RepID=A0A077S6I7_WHEAT|nr:unnamed protein product [Triticum aestivum]
MARWWSALVAEAVAAPAVVVAGPEALPMAWWWSALAAAAVAAPGVVVAGPEALPMPWWWPDRAMREREIDLLVQVSNEPDASCFDLFSKRYWEGLSMLLLSLSFTWKALAPYYGTLAVVGTVLCSIIYDMGVPLVVVNI